MFLDLTQAQRQLQQELREYFATLIAPAPEDILEMHEVSPAVNSAANDTPDLIAPVTAEVARAHADAPASKRKTKQDTRQGSLF